MKEIILGRDERLALRARAHHLDPVVLLGSNGLTEAVLKEIDRELRAHELIKVRVPTDDRELRESICAEVAEKLGAARVQSIGKLFVLWRPSEEMSPEEAFSLERLRTLGAAAPKAQEPVKAKKVASKKPGEAKKRTEPTPRRARPRRTRKTKKAALS